MELPCVIIYTKATLSLIAANWIAPLLGQSPARRALLKIVEICRRQIFADC
jgi:hypothetical protein